jgi:transposase-like protein
MAEFICPKCGHREFWKTGDNRLKCKKCRYLFTPKENPFKIPEKILKEVISDFLLEHSTNIILERVKISKYKLLKALSVMRILMTKDVIESFGGKIKIDEDYFKDKIKKILENDRIKKSPEKNKKEIIGIFCDEKKCYAKILPEIKVKDLKIFLKNKNLFSQLENWQGQIALVWKDSIYRLTRAKQKVDNLSVFWGYLKMKLSEKGGIRKERLPFYLGEYCWRFNNRKKSLKEKEKILLDIILKYFHYQNF